jgi:acyl-CoA-binding protein
MSVEETFANVLNVLKDIDLDSFNLSDPVKLDFYKYYKQATIGDCNITEPSFFYYRERAKWAAWKDIKGTSKEDAMKNYIEYYNTHICKV